MFANPTAGPVALARLPDEITAAMLVARLGDEGIPAEIIGGASSGFRIGIPTQVDVIVRAADADRASKTYAAWREEMQSHDNAEPAP